MRMIYVCYGLRVILEIEHSVSSPLGEGEMEKEKTEKGLSSGIHEFGVLQRR